MGNIDQLKELQQPHISVQLDKNIARLANFIFRIESVALIRSINLDTLLEFVIFHIVSINTSFLLCLDNIDKYRAFFNNITNQVIQ